MPYARTVRLETPLVCWQDVRLIESAPAWGPTYAPPTPRLLWPQSQWLECEIGGESFVADPITPVWLTPERGYRLRQPCTGQRSVLLALRPDIPLRSPERPRLNTTLQLSWSYLAAATLSGFADALAVEEWLAELMHADAATRPTATTRRTRRAVERARERLAADPACNDTLAKIAAHAHCSPYHLARHFRAIHGLTLHDYRQRLRLSLALARLREGERDLATLAVDLGYTSHSHFTACFRHRFGVAPGQFRSRCAKRTRSRARI